MAITLANVKNGMSNKVDVALVETFRQSSLLLDKLTFDNVIQPGIGSNSLKYGYVQVVSPGVANVRITGQEFAKNQAIKNEMTARAIPMGSAFEVDRLTQEHSMMDEIAFQAEQKIKATAALFHELAINGDEDNSEFDGLEKLLWDADTRVTSKVSIATAEELDTNYNAFLDELDTFISKLGRRPDILMMNTQMLIKLRAIARRAGFYERTSDAFGNPVETYAGIPMVDMGKNREKKDIIPTESGKTRIYAACLGLDGFHGISLTGNNLIRTYLPDMNAPGAVKRGEVELVAGVVLKAQDMAGVLEGINVGA